MKESNFLPARARPGIIDSSATSTASGFAAVVGSKWVLQNAAFGFCSAVSCATISFFETSATGSFSETNVFFQTFTKATSGAFFCDFGKVGAMASDTNSRFGVAVGSCTFSWTFLASGYYQSS